MQSRSKEMETEEVLKKAGIANSKLASSWGFEERSAGEHSKVLQT